MKTDLPIQRLRTQHIVDPSFKTPAELLGYMGIMQAQDPLMVKWAMGLRLPHLKETDIEEAYRKGDVLRTHVIRPTWHLVSPQDIYWMLDLSRKRILSAMNPMIRQLQLDEKIFFRCNRIFEKALGGGKHLTREALCDLLEKDGIQVNEYRSGQILCYAEIHGVLCSGPIEDKKHTYALLEERVPQAIRLDKEEAVSRLASTYFRSHGPASVADFCWWSGLSLGEARKGLESVKKELRSLDIDGNTYWFAEESRAPKAEKAGVALLPAFDEYMISYKDRSAMLPKAHYAKAVSGNGIFWPVILSEGRVIGTWKREIKKNDILVTAMYFKEAGKSLHTATERAVSRLGHFLSKEVRLEHRLHTKLQP